MNSREAWKYGEEGEDARHALLPALRAGVVEHGMIAKKLNPTSPADSQGVGNSAEGTARLKEIKE